MIIANNNVPLSFAIKIILLFSLVFYVSTNVYAQSGYQVIQGTRVFTEVFQSEGYARFSNDCGSQTITQRQLQAGAIPTNIIPCPRPEGRRSSTPQTCPDGSVCRGNAICDKNNSCVSSSSGRICSDGKSYCSENSICHTGNKCIAVDDPRVCTGFRVCPVNHRCHLDPGDADQKCIPNSSSRICRNGNICTSDQICTAENSCLSRNNTRVCSDGRMSCEQGAICTSDLKCVRKTDGRVCSSNAICPPGTLCDSSNKCVSYDQPRVCSDKSLCQADELCTTNNDIKECIKIADSRVCSDSKRSCKIGSSCTPDFNCLSNNDPRMCSDGRFCAVGQRCTKEITCEDQNQSVAKTPIFEKVGCECISVTPTVERTTSGDGFFSSIWTRVWYARSPPYLVTNSCSSLDVKVKFVNKYNTTMSKWVWVGNVSLGEQKIIYAPVYEIVHVGGVETYTQTNTSQCMYP